MRIIDGQRTIELPDDDPVVPRIRALLYQPRVVDHPLPVLWEQASGPLREVLVLIAKHHDISQIDLEKALGVTGVGLRGRNAALARVAKRVGVDYPVRQSGGRREFRQFSLVPGVASQILKLAKGHS
jgi:hypothetical protein